MSNLTLDTHSAKKLDSLGGAKHELTGMVDHWLTSCQIGHQPWEPKTERRGDRRRDFPELIQLIPVDPKSLREQGAAIWVIGKQISASGLGFFHAKIHTHAYFLVSLADFAASQNGSLLWRCRWCRFRAEGWYESGGPWLRVASASDLRNVL